MAGYLFGLGTKNAKKILEACISKGVYSTELSLPKNKKWQAHHEGTFADYASMKPGDNVYFFIKRKVYGIGVLTEVGGFDCKFLNYPESNVPKSYSYDKIKNDLLVDFGAQSPSNRFICTFAPDPYFFENGIDMDDLLSSNPNSFKMLRAFWKRSFIKFDDTENQAFRDIILNRNIAALNSKGEIESFTSDSEDSHKNILSKLLKDEYELSVTPLLSSVNKKERILHEMAIEASLITQISKKEESVVDIFGQWDYLSHQVVASPFKPVDYMDKMDVFGYAYIDNQQPTISNFLVVEIKKDKAKQDDLLQLMKYVDWVKDEYAHGDYSRIFAYLVAFDFADECKDSLLEKTIRNYIYGVHPAVSKTWSNVKLISYRYSDADTRLNYQIVK